MLGMPISNKSQLNYLGVIFYRKFLWMPNLVHLKDKVELLLYKITNLSRATWGLKASVLKIIYQLAVKKMIMYGSEIWYTNTARILQKLTQLRCAPLLNITKYYKTVSTDAFCVLSACIPLHLKIEMELELKEYFQNLHDNHKLLLNQIGYYILYNPIDHVIRTFDDRYDEWEIYTIGSKMNNEVACSYVIYNNKIELCHAKFKISCNSVLLMVKLAAIYKAVLYISLNNHDRKYTVLTDFMSALESSVSVNENRLFIINLRNKI